MDQEGNGEDKQKNNTLRKQKSWHELRQVVRNMRRHFSSISAKIPSALSFRLIENENGQVITRIYFLGTLSGGRETTLLYADIPMHNSSTQENTSFSWQPLLESTFQVLHPLGQFSREEQLQWERKRLVMWGITAYDLHNGIGRFIFPACGSIFYCDDNNTQCKSPPYFPQELRSNVSGARLNHHMCPQNPDLVAYIYNSDLWLYHIKTLTEVRLTYARKGSNSLSTDPISAGIPSYVIQEEFNRYSGYWWQPVHYPNEENIYRILYEEVDESDVEILHLPSYCDEHDVEEFRFPRAGKMNLDNLCILCHTNRPKIDSTTSRHISPDDENKGRTHILYNDNNQHLSPPGTLSTCSNTNNGNRRNIRCTEATERQLFKVNSTAVFDKMNKLEYCSVIKFFVLMKHGFTTLHLSKTTVQAVVEPGGSAPKKAKTIASAGKVMASDFWDSKGILLIDYLSKGQTINGEYYVHLLDQLDEKIREKRHGLQKKKILFHQDNAPAHKGALAMVKLRDLKYKLLEHSPYSPDLAASDFHLFPNLKKFLGRKHIGSSEEVIAVVNGYFEDLPESHFRDGIQLLKKHWDCSLFVSIQSNINHGPFGEVYRLVQNGSKPFNITAQSLGYLLEPPSDDTYLFIAISLSEFEYLQPELFSHSLKSGQTIYGMIFKPPFMQSNKKYPTVLTIYGGPEVQLVTNTYKGMRHLRQHLLAQEGYIVVAADCRGSRNRGIIFESHIKGRMVHDVLHFFTQESEDELTFLWASEESGFRHLYLITVSLLMENFSDYIVNNTFEKPETFSSNRVQKKITLTEGEWEVSDKDVWVQEEKRLVFFIGLKDTPLERHLYVVSLDYPRNITCLTVPGFSHVVAMNKDCSLFVSIQSNINHGPFGEVYRLVQNGSKPFNITAQSLGYLLEPPSISLSEFEYLQPELFSHSLKSGQTIYGMIFKPPFMQSNKKYPTVLTIYGGPEVQLVTNTYKGMRHLRQHLLAQEGYIVVAADCRGSRNRGIIFESHIKGRMGTVEIADQVEVLLKLAETTNYIDLDRVAIHGWSYGGYLSLMGLAQRPDIFKIAVAGAPVTSWNLYDTGYTERYMDTPTNNPEGYSNGSVLSYVSQLPNNENRLLIIHGLMDENVHFSHTSQLINAMIKAGKPYQLQVYPTERHSLRHLDASEHYDTKLLSFFQQYL
ncbi:dipeptidyl peptidase 9-like [Centruroides sculpturatus]|uniref:dipeptidyl peptidase 9-like n=1 Tax=Centruroides sculpturatus TaxID=218467 RepID=UPI000C6D00CD|nr:dipeptidyl peptidase 9-like [Centruroides sculpturatus]